MFYSLNLESGRKYVGKTNNIKRRMEEHFGGRGAKWTKKYTPVSINHIQVCKNETNQARAENIVAEKWRSTMGKNGSRWSTYFIRVLSVWQGISQQIHVLRQNPRGWNENIKK